MINNMSSTKNTPRLTYYLQIWVWDIFAVPDENANNYVYILGQWLRPDIITIRLKIVYLKYERIHGNIEK